MKTQMSYSDLIKSRLAKVKVQTEGRSKAYWNLRNAGFNNIDAEEFLAKRRHWFN